MKVSIIIPSSNEEQYIADLLQFIRANTNPMNIEDIILVDTLSRKNLIKVAEKAHAKLFLTKNSDFRFRLEAGAFQANGEILYFIKPGCFPPYGFDERILHAVKTKYLAGGFRVKPHNRTLWQRLICMVINCGFSSSSVGKTSFFMTRNLFHRIGGFRKREGSWASTSEVIQEAACFSRFKIISDYATIR